MKKFFVEQLVPLILTVFTFLVLSTLLYGLLLFLNSFLLQDQIILDFRKRDVLIGIAVYLKTAIDFAIFIGNLMRTNPGWKKRIAIELGTAVGNAFGTFLVLTAWIFLKQIPILMAGMIFVASIILLRMAQESLQEFLKQKKSFIRMRMPVYLLQAQLNFINKIFRPVLGFFVPDLNLTRAKKLSFANLIVFSFTIPFVLGLDDFAGYISLFSIMSGKEDLNLRPLGPKPSALPTELFPEFRVPRERVELSRPIKEQGLLRPPCMPFHHRGAL
jgi:hypothetical protein